MASQITASKLAMVNSRATVSSRIIRPRSSRCIHRSSQAMGSQAIRRRNWVGSQATRRRRGILARSIPANRRRPRDVAEVA